MTPQWTTECRDWENRILTGQSLIPFPPLFPAEAEAALEVLRDLRLVDAPGSPRMGEVSRPWVFDFSAAVFGAYDHEIGRRLIREFFLLVSKKNTKSTTAAAIMLTALIRNWRRSGEFLILAPTIEIANNSFKPAADMIRDDPELTDLLHVQNNIRQITHKTTHATLKVVAADNESVGGKKAIGVLIDELWLFGKRPQAENMLREATGGLASRPEGFVIYLSTQSDEPPSGVFAEKLAYARQVRDGTVKDKRFLPVLYEFPKKMIDDKSYRDKRNFHITNPNLGASVDVEFIEREFDKAEVAGEASLCGFFAKHLNIEIGMALRADGWAGANVWNRGVETGLSLADLLKRSEMITIGVDGGGLDDLFGLAVLGRETATRKWLLWTHALVSREGIERRKANAVAYSDFATDGDLTVVEGLPDDLDYVVSVVERAMDSGLLGAVCVDPACIGPLVDELEAIGVSQDNKNLEAVTQGIKQMGAIKTVERKLVDGTFKHGGQRLMNWCVGNAKIVPTPTAMRIARDESGMGKIDPLMAMFNAVEGMIHRPESGMLSDGDIRFI